MDSRGTLEDERSREEEFEMEDERGEWKRGCEREGVCVSEQINGRERRGGVGA